MYKTESKDKSNKTQNLNSLAIASIILGFWGAFIPFFAALPAVICGHIVLSRIKNNPIGFRSADKRLAIGGLIFGYFSIIAWGYVAFSGLAILFEWDLRRLFPYGMGA